jgi:hypothetical protein
VKAWVRYGASNWTYRGEVTVSGRITAMLPLPELASGFRPAIALKVLLKSLTESDGAEPLALAAAEAEVELDAAGAELLLELLELLQPAATSTAANAAAAVRPARADTEYNGVPRSHSLGHAAGGMSETRSG